MNNEKVIWTGLVGRVGGSYVCFLLLATSVKRDFALKN